MAKVYLSTITPVYRGGAYLRVLCTELRKLKEALEAEGSPVELIEAIFVDDASVDDSPEVLSGLQTLHSWIKVVTLSRNFGQHPATAAGILHSSGDWVVTLDEDLQHHPRHVVPLLVHAVSHRLDIVYANAEGAVHRTWFRNASSRSYKTLVGWLVGNPKVRDFSSFRLLRGSIGRAAAAVSTHDTYYDVVLSWFTDRIGSLRRPLVDVRSMENQQSGYSVWSLLRHARRMLVSSHIKLLRLGATTGLITVLASLVLFFVTLILKITHPERIAAQGWTSIILAIAFFGGLTAFLVGISLEYMSILLLQAHGKPTFFVVDRSKDELLAPLVMRHPPE